MRKLAALFLLSLIIQSCLPEKQLEVSLDANQQRYSGPSYPNSSPNSLSPGGNLGFYIIGGLAGTKSTFSGTYNNVKGADRPFYASADNDLRTLLPEPRSTNFTDNVFLKSGLELVVKNSREGGSTISLGYLEVPVYALYRYNLGGNTGKIFGGLGPYFAYGIFGSSGVYGQDAFKRFDAGLGLTAGYQMRQSLSFSLGYSLGLTNIQNSDFGDKAHNRTISLSVGYSLDKLIGKRK